MRLAALILSTMGGLLMMLVGLLKRKDHMLIGQCAQFSLQGISHFLVGSVSGGISTTVGIVRILVFSWVKVTALLKLGFILLQLVLTWWSGADTLLEWLPMLAMVAYTWYLDTENVVLFKLVNLLGSSLWLAHDVAYGLYTLVVFDILTICSLIIGIIRVMKDNARKKTAAEGETSHE